MPPRQLKMGAIAFTPPAPALTETPRFLWFHRRIRRTKSDTLRFYVAVVEMKPGKFIFSTHPRQVKRVLYKSPVIKTRATPEVSGSGRLIWHDDELREVMDRASRVTQALNTMRLALEAWEMEENGLEKLFDHLWYEDCKDQLPDTPLSGSLEKWHYQRKFV